MRIVSKDEFKLVWRFISEAEAANPTWTGMTPAIPADSEARIPAQISNLRLWANIGCLSLDFQSLIKAAG